ncbi:hypothetical protein LTR86_000293 [Recurvomyces mirabilis]|nr:hypothetical protein LTR86_000293 [Recurvomyces mirabilis]
MTTTDSFCEKHFLGLVVFIASFSLYFFSSLADDGNILVRQLALVVSLVDLYLIFFGKQTVTKVTSPVTSPPPPPPPAKPDDPAPFWQLSPSTKTVFSKPPGEVGRTRKKLEASQRQRLVEEERTVPAKQTTFRTPPNLRRAAVLRATYAEAGWHRSTAPDQANPAPVQTTSTAPAAPIPAPAPAPTSIPAATTTVIPPTAPQSSLGSKKAPEKTSEVFSKSKAFPFGTRPYAIHMNMHEQMDAQYRRYLETVEAFSGFGTSLPGKCSYCDYEVPLVKERRKIHEMLATIHKWQEAARDQFETAKAKAIYPAQLGQELATHQAFKKVAQDIKDFIAMLLFWCTKLDASNPRIRLPDLTKLQTSDLAALGVLGANANRLINLLLEFDEHTKHLVPEYNTTYQYLRQLKTLFEAWPTSLPRQPCLSPNARANIPALRDDMVHIVGFGNIPDMIPLMPGEPTEGNYENINTAAQGADISTAPHHVEPQPAPSCTAGGQHPQCPRPKESIIAKWTLQKYRDKLPNDNISLLDSAGKKAYYDQIGRPIVENFTLLNKGYLMAPHSIIPPGLESKLGSITNKWLAFQDWLTEDGKVLPMTMEHKIPRADGVRDAMFLDSNYRSVLEKLLRHETAQVPGSPVHKALLAWLAVDGLKDGA